MRKQIYIREGEEIELCINCRDGEGFQAIALDEATIMGLLCDIARVASKIHSERQRLLQS